MTEFQARTEHAIDVSTRLIPRYRRSRLRSLILGIGAFGGAFLLMALLCEAALWIFAPIPFKEPIDYQPDGHLRAIPKPNQVVRNQSGHEIRINKYGFRGPDYAFENTPGTLRIAVFGGSAAFCFRASGREKTWPGALEIMLADRLQMPVEVINLGVPGYNVFTSKINYLCFGRAFRPDAIIVYHTWNDMKRFRELAVTPHSAAGVAKGRPLWKNLARRTQLGRRGFHAKWNLKRRRAEDSARQAEDTGMDADAPVDEKAIRWERANFVDFAELAKRDGVLPVLVSQASLYKKENMNDREIRVRGADCLEFVKMTFPVTVQTWLRVSGMIEKVANEHGAIFVDGYNAVPADLDHLHDHVHLYDAGCEALAKAIARSLLEDSRFIELTERVRSAGLAKPAAFMHRENRDHLADQADQGSSQIGVDNGPFLVDSGR